MTQIPEPRKTFPPLKRTLALLLPGMLALALGGCASLQKQTDDRPVQSCQRIVSLSPSITEIVYQLDLQDQLVGVTRYCTYPAAARKKASIGGYIDPDMETLLRLKPDVVILRTEMLQGRDMMRRYGIPYLPVEHRTMAGILQSIREIGHTCNREAQAKQVVSELTARLDAVEKQAATAKTRPRVLIALDRDVLSKNMRWIYTPAQDGIFNWALEKAGATTAVDSPKKGFLKISTESILRMNPDIIIEMLPSVEAGRANVRELELARAQWQSLQQVNAVKNKRIYLFPQEFMVIPGPRFVHVVETFARVIHPELDWKNDPDQATPYQ